MPPHRPLNHLAQETSPYLLQHADNPVDWYPWSDEAFAKARAENKSILLSIGYSACHWCHVMAHESFEDLETAEIMNGLFVNIKLDREERPDIDKIYQTSQSLITQRTGGWPLTMFLDPQDRCPFFGGTYFPKEPRHNLPPFKQILKRVHAYYTEHRRDISKQNQALKDSLHEIYSPTSNTKQPSISLIETAQAMLLKQFDQEYGGFSNEPKFPHSELIQFMLYRSVSAKLNNTPNPQAEHAALYTLEKMCRGGLYDHLGGGFYRYSVDAAWQIPHFEKMLYDNGPLLGLLVDAWHINSNQYFAETAHETAHWVMREMQSSEDGYKGGYYATLDADSEGSEGTFYVWHKDEVNSLLNTTDAAIAIQYFGLNKVPNFEGQWHLHLATEVGELVKTHGNDNKVRESIERIKKTLFLHREKRPRPRRDDKIITSWNALMIKGMAKSAQLLGEDKYYRSATQALDFIRANLWHDKLLSATFKNKRARFDAYLDDYAFLLDAIFHLLQYHWRDDDFAFALDLADAILTNFEDTDNGGYYFTSHKHEQLLQRPRALYDEATPSGYSIATLSIARFGLLCSRNDYLTSAHRALAQAAPTIAQTPSGCTTLLHALAEKHEPPEIVIIRTSEDISHSILKPWQHAIVKHYSPLRFCFVIPSNAKHLPLILRDKKTCGDVTAYICQGTNCLAPIDDLDKFTEKLVATSPVNR